MVDNPLTKHNFSLNKLKTHSWLIDQMSDDSLIIRSTMWLFLGRMMGFISSASIDACLKQPPTRIKPFFIMGSRRLIQLDFLTDLGLPPWSHSDNCFNYSGKNFLSKFMKISLSVVFISMTVTFSLGMTAPGKPDLLWALFINHILKCSRYATDCQRLYQAE